MRQFIIEAHSHGRFLPAKEIKKKMNFTLGVRRIRQIIQSLGLKWGRRRFVGSASKEQLQQRMRHYTIQMSIALREESNGRAIIVFPDESYIHTGYKNPWGCYAKGSSSHSHVRKNPGTGKRIIIVHAMTKDGLVVDPAFVRNGEVASGDFSVIQNTCEAIF